MRGKQFNWLIMVWVFLLATVIAAAGQKQLTNDDVIKMVKAGLPEDTIVLAIQKSPNKFDTSPDALIALKAVGATQKVLNAILQFQTSSTSATSIGSSAGVTVGDPRLVADLPPQPKVELNLGTYKAAATEILETENMPSLQQPVMIRIKIESIDKNGNVKAEIFRYGVKGSLKGTIDAEGKLQLEGIIIDSSFELKITLTATSGDKTLTKGKYLVMSAYSKTKGVFNTSVLDSDN